MKINLLVLFTILFGITSALLKEDTLVNLHYVCHCEDYNYKSWSISGIVNGEEVVFHDVEGRTCTTLAQASISVNRTDDLNYKICYSTKNPGNMDSYMIVYDSDNNMLVKKHALYENNFCSLFTIRKPIDTVSSMTFKRGNVPENWYKKTFDSTSWETVQNGQQTSASNENQYYRISFEETQFDLMAAYNLHLQLNGDITIYMNDIQVYNAVSINPLILNAYPLQTNNTLSIMISNPKGISLTNYLSIYMTLFFATEKDKCANTLVSFTSKCSNSVKCDLLVDSRVYTYWDTSKNSVTNTITLKNNTFIDLSRYLLIPSPQSKGEPTVFYIKGRDSDIDTWNILDYRSNVKYELWVNTFDINGTTIPKNQIQIDAEATYPKSVSLAEMFLFTCNRIPQLFQYMEHNYTYFADYSNIIISPQYNGYSAISIEPQLPRGLSFDPNNGNISGRLLEASPETQYTITAQYPHLVTAVIYITIISSPSASHIKVERHYANDYYVVDEIFTIKNKNTQRILLDEPKETVQKSDTTLYYEFSVSSDIYEVILGEAVSERGWAHGSYLSIYIATQYIPPEQSINDMTGYYLIFQEAYTLLGSTNMILNFEYLILQHAEWKHNEGSIPSDWFSSTFDDSNWLTESIGQSPISKAIHIYRKTFNIDSIDMSDSVEVQIAYYSGIVIYINNKKVFINHIDEPITTGSTATNFYGTLITRRIVFSMDAFKLGDNTIAVMLIPHADEPTTNYIFDMYIRNMGKGDVRTFMNDICDSEQINAFDHDYSTVLKFYTSITDTIYYKNTLDEYSILSMYAFVADYSTYEDERPQQWILQGRKKNRGDEEWIDIDKQTNVNWDTKKQRRMFGIPRENQGLYNEYRLTGIKGLYNEIQLLEIEFYSNSMVYNYPSFEYTPNDVSVYIGTYLDELVPKYDDYYTNYTITPALPTGIALNPKTGSIRGIPDCPAQIVNYTITASRFDNTLCSNTILISYKSCTDGQSILEVDIHYNNNYKSTELDVTSQKRETIISTFSISEVYREFRNRYEDIYLIRRYFMCIPHGMYTVKLTPNKPEKMGPPYGYSIRNSAGTILNSGSFDETHAKAVILLDSSMPIQSGVTLWSYFVSNDDMGDWTSKYYDIESWEKMKENNMKCNEKKNIYFRTAFSIDEITSHSSLDFRIKTIGSIYVYMNEDLVYYMNIDNSTLVDHTFTLSIQNNALKSKNNILAIHIETKDILETEYLYVDCAYTYGAQTRLMNTFTYSSSSSFSPSHPLSNMFDIDFFTTTEFTGDSQIVNIDMGNEYKRYFNSIFLQTWNSSHPKTMDIYGRQEDDHEWIPLLEKFEIPEKGLYTEYISVPMGVAGFRYIQLYFNKHVKEPISSIISEFNFVYQSYNNSMCPSAYGLLSVGEDYTSYGFCGDNNQGYIYSVCDGLRFDPPNRSFCTLLPPKFVRYPEISYIFFTDTSITPLLPTYERVVDSFNIQPALPSGLFFESETGKIFGKPTTIMSTTTYTLQAINKNGMATFEFTIQINPGYCSMQSYPPTNIHETLILPCPDGYYGQIQVLCETGKNEPTYAMPINECTSLVLTISVTLSITVAVILLILLLLCMRTNKKNKEEIHRLRNPAIILKETSNTSIRSSQKI
ncbi:hypothetical protein WA158_007118 [Blastocystis sp. Blastoise]